MKYKKLIFTCVICLNLMACARLGTKIADDMLRRTTYQYIPTSEDDPEIRFISNFKNASEFYINNTSNDLESCRNLERVGYILEKGFISTYRKNNKEVVIKTKADQLTTIVGIYFGVNVSCGPIQAAFTPLSGHKYIFALTQRAQQCLLSGISIDKDNNVAPVALQRLPKKCTK